jgi:hypothetical protein
MTQAPKTVVVRQRKHAHWCREHRRQRLADQDAVAVHGGRDRNPPRKPIAHHRWKGGLCDGDANAHKNRAAEQHGDARPVAAQCAEDGDSAEACEQRASRAQPGDEERARDRDDGKDQDRTGDQGADRLLVEMKVAVDRRDQGRHGEKRQTGADAAEPQEQQPQPVGTRQAHGAASPY